MAAKELLDVGRLHLMLLRRASVRWLCVRSAHGPPLGRTDVTAAHPCRRWTRTAKLACRNTRTTPRASLNVLFFRLSRMPTHPRSRARDQERIPDASHLMKRQTALQRPLYRLSRCRCTHICAQYPLFAAVRCIPFDSACDPQLGGGTDATTARLPRGDGTRSAQSTW